MEDEFLDPQVDKETFIQNDCGVNTSTDPNRTSSSLPCELAFDEDSIRELVIYTFLFVLAVAGNVPVFVSLLRNRRHRKSRIKLMILHLAIADLIVTFIMIPLEIFWRVTVRWIAGNLMCKLLLFLRAFGPYLSSMVLVCISLDRYFAILHPLKVNDAQRRGKIMLALAWIISTVCSIPQSVIFRVMQHPEYPHFEQCVSFKFFTKEWHETAYHSVCLVALYWGPLAVIVYCYSRILWVISRRSRPDSEEDLTKIRPGGHHRMRLRRSDMTHIERARARTLRMTIIIVLAFILCWTPYVVMVAWYLVDPQAAKNVDPRVQSSLFVFAVSNSCVNPLVYGSYALNFKQLLRKGFRFLQHPTRGVKGDGCCDDETCVLSRQPSRHTVLSTRIFHRTPTPPTTKPKPPSPSTLRQQLTGSCGEVASANHSSVNNSSSIKRLSSVTDF